MAVIHAASFPSGEQWDAAALATQLALPGTFALVDPAGGFVLARVAADEAEILTLAVMPELRRQGRGARLLAAAEGEARARGALVMFLEVSEYNSAAQEMYVSARYEMAGRRRRYYADGADALVLRKALIPDAAEGA